MPMVRYYVQQSFIKHVASAALTEECSVGPAHVDLHNVRNSRRLYAQTGHALLMQVEALCWRQCHQSLSKTRVSALLNEAKHLYAERGCHCS